MAPKTQTLAFNDNNHNTGHIIEQLKNGSAQFQLIPSSSPPLPSISLPVLPSLPSAFHGFNDFHGSFAQIGPPLGGSVPTALKKVEHYSVQKVTGDGRCMFRALVKGMAFNRGIALSPREERDDADELRLAVKEIICDSGEDHRRQYEEALIAITVDESLKRYCQRIERADFWGGESELLVISRFCRQPIIVYIPEHEHRKGGWGSGFIPIAEYGSEFHKKKGKHKKVVRLLYSGRNHYDLLV